MQIVNLLMTLLLAWMVAPATAAEPIHCDSSVPVESLPQGLPLLIFGEIHGTDNAPAYFGDVVCAALKSKRYARITVALEYPVMESEPLQAYLASPGRVIDQIKLTDSPFWTRDMQDGRTSRAMLALIERLRAMQRQDPALHVAAFDPVEDVSAAPTRDEAMAVNVRRLLKATEPGITLVLTGNLHAKRTPGFGGNPAYKTLASELDLPFKTYAFVAHSGQYWACVPDCGVQSMAARSDYAKTADPDLRRVLPTSHYDGLINLGVYRASLPARENAAGQTELP